MSVTSSHVNDNPSAGHYATCVWTRDSSLVSLALKLAGKEHEARKAVMALASLYMRPAHSMPMDALIASGGENYCSTTAATIKFDVVSGDRIEVRASFIRTS